MTWSKPLAGPPALGPDAALFLDVDGTLLPIAATPEAVAVPPSLRGLLDALRHRLGGALALVSGRTVADIDRLFHPLVLPAAGLHGLERRPGSGPVRRPGRPAWVDRIVPLLEDFVARHPGALFEDKGLSLALHYRLAPSATAAAQRILAP